MNAVIDFFFSIWEAMFSLIKQYWILGAFFLLNVLKFVIDIIKVSKSD